MVELSLRTPLGIPVNDRDFDRVYAELERAGRFTMLTREALEGAVRSLTRDALLKQISGRWRSGHPDPEDFVPGDAAAVRAIVCDAIVRDVMVAAVLQGKLGRSRPGDWLVEQPVLATLVHDVANSVPFFMPTTAAAAVLASHPPHTELREDLRLPFDKTLVLFGADLELDPMAFPWPPQFPSSQGRTLGVVDELFERGGYLTGVVLLADDAGHLEDDVIWLVAAKPDPHLPWPASLDRIRGAVRGWRGVADLAPLIDNVAAAVAWATWRQPPPPPELPSHLQEIRFRKAFKRNSVRVRERQGALVGVRVLDLGRTANAKRSKSPYDEVAGRQSPIPHLRSGHFRRVRIGPRANFHYEVRWIPPVWVQGDPDRTAERLVVRRIPAPVTWTQPAPHPTLPREPGRILGLDGSPTSSLARAVPDEDPFGIDLQ